MQLNNKDSSNSYIIASCKDWHYNSFLKIKEKIPANWFWVEKPKELASLVDEAKPRYIFFIHWNWFVPEAIFKNYESVCFHMTDVPYGRGGSPLQNLILAGHSDTKLTALKMVEEMDAGPVYAKRTLSLAGRAQEIYENAGELSFHLIEWIIKNNPLPKEQEGAVTTFKRRQPEQSEIAKNFNPKKLYDFIRMLDAEGYPHAFIDYGNLKLELTNAKIEGEGISAQVNILFKDGD